MAELRATPMSNPILGLLADRLKKAQQFGAKPFGYENPPVEMLMNLLGVPAVQQTMERMAYGEPLTTGSGMTTKPRPEAIEAAMTVVPVGGLLGKSAEKGAMAVGRAGERYAEKVVPQILERGGLPAEMVQAMGSNTRSLLDVYHGSPHGPFNKFDPSKARTGEGNASYGEGAYLAEARGTGEAYRKNLSDFDISVDGKPFNPDDVSHMAAMSVWQAGGNKKKAIETLKEASTNLKQRNVSWADSLAEQQDQEIKFLQKTKEIPKYEEISKGYLYKVDLPDEAIPKMLDWDKPLSQQTPEVRAALEQLGYRVDKEKVSEFDDALLNALVNDGPTELPKQPLDLSGEAVYTKLRQSFANNDRLNAERDALIGKYQKEGMSWSQAVRAMSPEDRSNFVDIANKIESQKNAGLMASEELQKLGITGIRYLDEASRGLGQGTSNFVVFPKYQDLLRIKEINDRPITSLLE
jgi:hypothetical protein